VETMLSGSQEKAIVVRKLFIFVSAIRKVMHSTKKFPKKFLLQFLHVIFYEVKQHLRKYFNYNGKD
jgi:hypothetical protein